MQVRMQQKTEAGKKPVLGASEGLENVRDGRRKRAARLRANREAFGGWRFKLFVHPRTN